MGLLGSTPTDLRPAPATPSKPHHTTQSYDCFYLRQRQRGGALQSPGVRRKKIHGELLRIPLPRTPMNSLLGTRLSAFPRYSIEHPLCLEPGLVELELRCKKGDSH